MTRGRLPASVYWRRRALVVGLLSALVLLGVSLVPSGDPPSESARPVASGKHPGDTSSRTPGGRHQGRKHKRDAGDKVREPVAPPAPVLATPVGTCDDSDIVVSPFVQGAIAGGPVTVTLRLRTAATAACTWRVSANHLAVKIAAGDDEVWASRECPKQVPATDVVVRRDVTSTLSMTWSARRSEAGCTSRARWVLPGSYQIDAAALGGEPDSNDFELAAPAPEVITLPPKDTDKSGGAKGQRDGHRD